MTAPTQQPTLFDPPDRKKGEVRKALDRQITDARKKGELDRAGALVEAARALADSLDISRMRKDPYGVVAAARELREMMAVLIPATQPADALDKLIEELQNA